MKQKKLWFRYQNYYVIVPTMHFLQENSQYIKILLMNFDLRVIEAWLIFESYSWSLSNIFWRGTKALEWEVQQFVMLWKYHLHSWRSSMCFNAHNCLLWSALWVGGQSVISIILNRWYLTCTWIRLKFGLQFVVSKFNRKVNWTVE